MSWKNPFVSYQGYASGFGSGYIRYWAGDPNSLVFTPANVKDGTAFAVLNQQAQKAKVAGAYFGTRLTFNGHGINHCQPVGMQVVSNGIANGQFIADISHGPTRQKRYDIEKRLRDEMYDLVTFHDYGVGLLNENNFPSGFPAAWSTQTLIDDFEAIRAIWGRKLVINLGGTSTDMEGYFRYLGTLGQERPQACRQDNYGRETWGSMYEDVVGFLGYQPWIWIMETSGGPNDYPLLGISPANRYAEFLLHKYTFFTNMGVKPNYPDTAQFAQSVGTYAPQRMNQFITWSTGSSPGNGGVVVTPVSLTINNGTITKLQTVPTEDAGWADANGQSSYTFESEHTAKVSVSANDPLVFMGWEFPDPQHPIDGPTGVPDTHFRTEGRGQDITVTATVEVVPPSDLEARVTKLEDDMELMRNELAKLLVLISKNETAIAETQLGVDKLTDYNDSWT